MPTFSIPNVFLIFFAVGSIWIGVYVLREVIERIADKHWPYQSMPWYNTGAQIVMWLFVGMAWSAILFGYLVKNWGLLQ